jgi:Zn-dependent protease
MTNRQFASQLALVSLLSLLALFGLFQVPKLDGYQWLGWISWGIFIMLSVLMYYFGKQSAHSTNKHTFTNTVMGFTVGKMILAVLLIVAYLQLAEPTDKLFIIPFFVVYFIFTAFETYVMMKLGRTGV